MHKIYSWQQPQWQKFITQNSSSNLPHAIMLSGNRGLGKSLFAKAMAETLLCSDATSSACGKCRSCKLIQNGSHPDLSVLRPEQAKKAIKIEQIRTIIDVVVNKPQLGGCQVVIIEPAEAMNLAAANALLKTLEEPPGNLFFILVAVTSFKLPATIRSRCQNIVFYPPSSKLALEFLQDRETDQQQMPLALQLAGNAPLLALELLQQEALPSYFELRARVLQLMQNSLDPISFASGTLGVDLEWALCVVQILLLDILKLKFTLNPTHIQNIDKVEVLQDLASRFSANGLSSSLDKITHLRARLVNNLNELLLLEDLALFLKTEVVDAG